MSNRIEKINSLMQKEIAKIISNELNDPRLNNVIVSVMSVETAPDVKYSKIFLSIYGTENKDIVIEAIKLADGYIKKLLAQRLKFRSMPELDFRLDNSLEYSDKINKIINSISKEN